MPWLRAPPRAQARAAGWFRRERSAPLRAGRSCPCPKAHRPPRFFGRRTHSQVHKAAWVGGGIADADSSQGSEVLPVGKPAAARRLASAKRPRPATSSTKSARTSAGFRRCAVARISERFAAGGQAKRSGEPLNVLGQRRGVHRPKPCCYRAFIQSQIASGATPTNDLSSLARRIRGRWSGRRNLHRGSRMCSSKGTGLPLWSTGPRRQAIRDSQRFLPKIPRTCVPVMTGDCPVSSSCALLHCQTARPST